MKKICFVTTVSLTMKSFVVETAKHLHETCGYDVTLICSPDEVFAASLPSYLHYIPVPMARGIDLSALGSIRALKQIFQREQFDLVQYSTPNASCYASLAAKAAGVPIRLYAQWGIRYVGMSGAARKVFRSIERMVCRLSTHVRSVSPMNMAFGIQEKLYPAEKVSVIGNGGTIGVDMAAYGIEEKMQWRSALREQYGIGPDDVVFGFAGRVSADKGCGELFEAFQKISRGNEGAKLLVVGPFEHNCGVAKELQDWANAYDGVILTGKVDSADMKKYYAAMDVLVHPTYREGFGMVIQEAGALAVPVITTRIPGASEVMVDGESCLLVEPKNVRELAQAMERICAADGLADRIGQAAYERTKLLYDRPIMLENQRKEYEKLLESW